MELNKTQCNDCGHLNRWHSFKWVDSPERAEHNRRGREECPECKSTNVSNVEDDETMGPYRFAADLLTGKKS